MQPTVTIKRLGWLAAATIVLGVLIGVGAGLLTLLLYGVEHVLLGYIEGPELPGPFGVPAARRAISVTVGLSIAGIIWYLLRHKTTAVPSVKKAVAGKRMPFWQTMAHVVLQIFIVGSGASIGREVAPRELGAMLAQRFCDLFHIEGVDGIDRRMVVAVAAGAGLGGVYDAPLAGMFFAVEILLVDVTIEKVAFGLGMSAIAAFVAVAIKGHCLFYDPGQYLTSGKGFVEMLLPIKFLPAGGWKFTGYEGLASHGGTLGLIIALWLYCRKTKLHYMDVLDMIAVATPITACCIRLANLMNSEIIGKPSDVPWAFIFERVDMQPRHPGQLYEAIAYLILFFIMIYLYKNYSKKLHRGFFFGLCLTYIFVFRFFIEFLKENQEDFENNMMFNMGQWLSIPFVIVGIYFMFFYDRKKKVA